LRKKLLTELRNITMRGVSTVEWIAKHPLSKGRRAQNIARFLAWQMRSRLTRRPHAFETANGAKMWAISGMTGATGNLYVGLHEFEEMAFLLHFLRRGDLFADVGANVGSYTILAAVAVGTDVIAFEPGESALSWLVRNVELNGVIDRVEVRREAVGAKSGMVFFTSGLDTMNHIAPDGVAVPIAMLDMACKKAPSLIKIDVEGFEADVLRGAREILSSPAAQAVIVELNDDAAAEFLKGFGFTCCSYDPFARGLSTREGSATGNGIFVRDVESAQRRLRDAPAFSIRGRVI
jgi:FkbM family methyltransferase